MKLAITLKVIAGLVVVVFVTIPIASWVDHWIDGRPIEIHWSFWAGLGLASVLLLASEILKKLKGKMGVKRESQRKID